MRHFTPLLFYSHVLRFCYDVLYFQTWPLFPLPIEQLTMEIWGSLFLETLYVPHGYCRSIEMIILCSARIIIHYF